MFCPKCGAEIPDDSVHCSSCGAKISGEGPGAGSATVTMLSALIKADPAGALTIVGSFFIILGSFLPWVTDGGSLLGVMVAEGPVVCLLGVLFIVVLLLARSGAAGPWNVIMFLLCALTLSLVFQAIYAIGDMYYGASKGAGVWLAMVGALVVTGAALLERFGAAKK